MSSGAYTGIAAMILNKTAIDSLPIPPTGYAIHWDDKIAGLGVRVTSTGVKAFVFQRRINGKEKRITIGRYGELTAEQAKKEAKKLAGQIAAGGDPVAEKARKKIESKPLKDAFEAYIERRTLKPQTVFDIRRCMKEVYPDWLDKPMTRITPDMVVKRHREYGQAHSEARANLAMRYLRAIFNFAAAEYTTEEGKPIIEGNPVKKLSQTKSWHRVDRRQTVIKPHELGAWVNAVLGVSGCDMRDYFMTVLLTGMRREEALKLWFGKTWTWLGKPSLSEIRRTTATTACPCLTICMRFSADAKQWLRLSSSSPTPTDGAFPISAMRRPASKRLAGFLSVSMTCAEPSPPWRNPWTYPPTPSSGC